MPSWVKSSKPCEIGPKYMNDAYWQVLTEGEPLRALQSFVQALWTEARLDALLVTVCEDPSVETRPRLIEDTADLDQVDPFKPLMTINSARLIPNLIQERPNARLGALLRPCEMRALAAMTRRAHIDIEHLLTISVDCLGTLPKEDYSWLKNRSESSINLHFARQGGIAAYRYRSACQVCTLPEAKEADINIHILGLPVRTVILVNARDASTAEHYPLTSITQGAANDELIRQHRRVAARLLERRLHTFQRVQQSLGELLPKDISGLIDQLESCDDCQTCLEVCPICSVDYPARDKDGRYQREGVMRWMISCAGCGMCEQSCPSHKPLHAIFAHIRQIIEEESLA
jgi:formate dehydrogenase subunit beta